MRSAGARPTLPPLATQARSAGGPDQAAVLRAAWRLLLQSQFHDTLAGTTNDAVQQEQAVRLDSRYINGTNELGMLYIAIAADARDSGKEKEMEEALQKAAHWHERALSIVPEEEARHRAEIRKRFAKAYREKGFHKEAEGIATPDDGKHFARQNGD